jgi:predicted transcriptional regulator of viral defense system
MNKIQSTYGHAQDAVARAVARTPLNTELTVREWADMAGVYPEIVRNYINNTEHPLLKRVARGVYRRIAAPKPERTSP